MVRLLLAVVLLIISLYTLLLMRGGPRLGKFSGWNVDIWRLRLHLGDMHGGPIFGTGTIKESVQWGQVKGWETEEVRLWKGRWVRISPRDALWLLLRDGKATHERFVG